MVISLYTDSHDQKDDWPFQNRIQLSNIYVSMSMYGILLNPLKIKV